MRIVLLQQLSPRERTIVADIDQMAHADTTRLAVTLGDPAGVGPWIAGAVAPFLADECLARLVFVGLPESVARFHPAAIARMSFAVPPALPSDLPALGDDSALGGEHAYLTIRHAIDLAQNDDVQGIVTLPISKRALAMAGHNFHGHTEILDKFAAAAPSKEESGGALMLLTNALGEPALSAIHMSTHMPLSAIEEKITPPRLAYVVRTLDQHWQAMHGAAPRIAVAGVNPHAGEDGMFGSIEGDILAPATTALSQEGYNIRGPFSPDTVYYRAACGEFDCVVSMYHDQSHIPIKLVAFHEAVNVTLGLKIFRCSVDHGVAYDRMTALKTSSAAQNLDGGIRITNFLAALRYGLKACTRAQHVTDNG